MRLRVPLKETEKQVVVRSQSLDDLALLIIRRKGKVDFAGPGAAAAVSRRAGGNVIVRGVDELRDAFRNRRAVVELTDDVLEGAHKRAFGSASQDECGSEMDYRMGPAC